MVEHARNIESDTPIGIEYIQGELTKDMNGVIDIILVSYVIPYLSNTDALQDFCHTIARVLRPGGRLVALCLNPEVRREKKHYEPYGIRIYGPSAGTDPDPMSLDLCYDGVDKKRY
jgi:SAM-dependent methyltransferase